MFGQKKKGFNDFIELAKLLDDNYRIVLVGVNKKQMKKLPSNIIGITRTENQKELAGLYSTADVFFNPSIEESFGLTTIEALMCKTFAITYNETALPEIMEDIDNVKICESNNIDDLFNYIIISDFKKVDNNDYNKVIKKYNKQYLINYYINFYGEKR